MQINYIINFLSIINKNIIYSIKFRVSDCTFKKIQGVDLHMTQSLEGIVYLF